VTSRGGQRIEGKKGKSSEEKKKKKEDEDNDKKRELKMTGREWTIGSVVTGAGGKKGHTEGGEGWKAELLAVTLRTTGLDRLRGEESGSNKATERKGIDQRKRVGSCTAAM